MRSEELDQYVFDRLFAVVLRAVHVASLGRKRLL